MVVERTNDWQTHVFVTPCWLLGAICALQLTVAGVISAVLFACCGAAILTNLTGRYWALCVAVAIWMCVAIIFASALLPKTGIVFSGGVTVILVFLVTMQTVRIGRVWGQARIASMRANGKPMREWEWVYTGRDFALSHQLAAGLGSIWSLIGFVILQWALIGMAAWTYGVWVGFTLHSVVAGILIWGLITRHPSAWVLAWWPLLMAFPLSLPLIMYWVDGVRPNLIYRHRFERLIPFEDAHV